MDTVLASPILEFTELENQPESPDIVPENSNCDQPISKEPNDVYKDICKGFTLVFDSKTMLKPKSPVTTPTTPTTPTRRHKRTFSVTSNQIFTDSSPDSPNAPLVTQKETDSEKVIEENLKNEISLLEAGKTPSKTESSENLQVIHNGKANLENVKNKKIANGGTHEMISKMVIKPNLQPAKNQNLRNGDYRKSADSFILHDTSETPRWKTVAIFLYFHITAAVGIFLVLSSQVMWQTIAFTIGLHVLSAFGVSINFIKPFVPQMFNLSLIYNGLSSFVVPTAIPWIMWEENILTAFLVVAQIGYCLHWYGSWFSGRKEKHAKNL